MSRPFLFVLLSAVLWAMQPAFILAAGRLLPDSTALFLVLNTAGTALVSLVVLLMRHSRARLVALLAPGPVRLHLALVIAVDSVAVAASYLFLALAARTGNLASAAIFFESWPIFVALLLFLVVPQRQDRNLPVLTALAFFVVGLLFINQSEGNGLSRLVTPGAALPVLSAICMAVGVFATQLLLRRYRDFQRFDDFLLVVFLRSSATMLVLVVAWAGAPLVISAAEPVSVAGRVAGAADWGLLATAMLFGVLVFANTVLYHLGVARANSNAVALVALLSPVLAPVFLFAVGLGVPSTAFFMGAAFIVAGLAVTGRTEDNSAQFQILITVMLAAGAVIVFMPGLGVESYFLYVQTTAVFYGLFQAAALSRLYGRYERVLNLCSEMVELHRCRRGRRHLTDVAIRGRELRNIKHEISSVSELVLLTLFAMANVALTIGGRQNGLEGDAIAFVITVASAFMILICWYYQIAIMQMTPRGIARAPRLRGNIFASRALSYLVSSSMFFWLSFVIAFKHLGVGSGG